MQEANKTHRIKKSPKPVRINKEPLDVNKRQSIFSTLSLNPQFGVFENQMQKQVRLQKFWKEEIDNYYKKNIDQSQIQLLNHLIEEEVPTLRDVVENPSTVLNPGKVPFEELFRYIELVRELRNHHQTMILIENADRNYIAIMEGGQLSKLIEVSIEQAFLAKEHHKFIERLQNRQRQYNLRHNRDDKLSEISTQIAYLLYIMKESKQKINLSLKKLNEAITSQYKLQPKIKQNVEDQYISFLFRKNLKVALKNQEIDYLNYFSNLDIIQQYGSIELEQMKLIVDKREFQEYMKRKKNKKTRKNPKGVLKTSCGGCLSAHHEQYNPFLYCFDCHIRFHKFCYTPIDGLCEPCYNRKNPQGKPRSVECQFCNNRGLLSLPLKTNRQGVFIHIFCMLINGLWKYENGCLQFQLGNFSAGSIANDECSICNCGVYTYQCLRCPNRGHPLCGYLSGWNMHFDERGKVQLQCCTPDLDKQKQSYRRKFMLNYKKFLYKSQKDR